MDTASEWLAEGRGLGTFLGVYTPSLLTILGVVMFLRTGWVVGNVGLVPALGIIVLAHLITIATALSVSAVATNMHVATDRRRGRALSSTSRPSSAGSCEKESRRCNIIRQMANRRIRATHLRGLVEATKGVAHPTRLRLLGMLASGELCVCQMTAVLELAPSTVSEHLAVLSRGGLISDRKQGRLVFYRLHDGEIATALLPPLLDLLAEDARAQADRFLVDRLRRIPVATLCAADLDLEELGVREPGAEKAVRT